MQEEIGQYLIADERVCHGKLTFKGTRVPVETVLRALARGETFDEVLEGWPELSRPALTEALRLAASALVEKYPLPSRALHEPAHSGRSA